VKLYKGGKRFQNLLDMRWVMDQWPVFGMMCGVRINHLRYLIRTCSILHVLRIHGGWMQVRHGTIHWNVIFTRLVQDWEVMWSFLSLRCCILSKGASLK
jgi:hypothetical protein